jgi:hypothetical protein
VGKDYKLNCIIKQQKDDSGNIIYINQYGGMYKYVEKDKKKYLVNGDDSLEITHIEKIQGAIILEPHGDSQSSSYNT